MEQPPHSELACGLAGVLVPGSVHSWRFWLGLGATVALGCGTDAVGVGDCRELERARCAAGPACGFPDVEACERYERDHCLHGLPLESISAGQIDACVLDIQRAGQCAASEGPATAANACATPVALVAVATACDVVRSPERAQSCSFLGPSAGPVPPPVLPSPDAGNEGIRAGSDIAPDALCRRP
jgi:hypothetical protein